MKYLLLPYALEQTKTKGVSPTTVYGWVAAFGKKNPYCKLVTGKSGYQTDAGPVFIEFKEYLTQRIESYKPVKRKAPVATEHMAPSTVTTSADLIRELEASVKRLRAMGYIVTCTIQTPAKEL